VLQVTKLSNYYNFNIILNNLLEMAATLTKVKTLVTMAVGGKHFKYMADYILPKPTCCIKEGRNIVNYVS
jgi:hypothetical protein